MTGESFFIGAPMISFALEEEQQIVQDTVRKLAAEAIRPRMREFERERSVPEALRRQVHELGLGLVDLPEAAGGHGAGLVTAAIVHEELAFGDPAAALALAAPHLAAQAIHALGDAPQTARLLARFATADGYRRLGAVAWAERDAPLTGFRTLARTAPGGYLLDGKKAFVVNGGIADLTVVFAQLEGSEGWPGIGAFVVEAGTPGLRMGARHDLVGLDAVHAAEVMLEGCKVPEANRLRGTDGKDLADGVRLMFARGSLMNAARQVGLARAAYEFALEYTQERKAFGKPVAHFQSVAFTLAEMHMDVESARWMVWKAAVDLERGRLETLVEAVTHANEAAWRVADNGVQLLGGAGYVKDYPVEKWLRDTKALALFAPPTEIAQLSVAGFELGHAMGDGLPSSAIQPFFT
jgi:acyl-CoA dehydrogenase